MATKPVLDFYPPVRQLRSLFYGVTDGVLTAPTPCPGWSVGDLLDHLTELTLVFTRAARRGGAVLDQDAGAIDAAGISTAPRAPSAAHLHPQWRGRLPALLEDLATAWADPAAWTGTAQAGGVTMPADRIGIVAVNELTLHGWDLAKATGQDFAADPRTLLVLATFLATADGSATAPDGTAGGSPVPLPMVVDVEDEASLLEQVVGLSGRDPHWRRS